MIVRERRRLYCLERSLGEGARAESVRTSLEEGRRSRRADPVRAEGRGRGHDRVALVGRSRSILVPVNDRPRSPWRARGATGA